MKRLLCLLALLMAAVYALPLLTVSFNGGQVISEEEITREEKGPAYDAETTITLCHEGEVVELDLHTYLCGVVAAEMPASFPEAALEAQAVAARTYSLYQLGLYDNGKAIPESHQGAQLCSDYTHCKAYTDLAVKSGDLWGANAAYYRDRITRAVERTDGRIATYEGEPIAAVFHSTSSERTESALAVWGNDTPYLVSVESPGGEASPRWQGEVVLSTAEVKEK
ncbi:MAG: SpoIID/LytB domain-containing protein, partial [Clostridia bacterium]|nr:SpoIID/LytB domain-containing protein [Clostridia bacterium]